MGFHMKKTIDCLSLCLALSLIMPGALAGRVGQCAQKGNFQCSSMYYCSVDKDNNLRWKQNNDPTHSSDKCDKNTAGAPTCIPSEKNSHCEFRVSNQ